MSSATTITFCECAENGYSLQDLIITRDYFINLGVDAIIYDLNYPIENLGYYPDDEAYILIIRQGVNYLLNNKNADDLKNELINLKWDTKAYMYGQVRNKKARYNLCFSNYDQKPDYANAKGRVISFNNLPILDDLKKKLNKLKINKNTDLVAEGNFYHDVNTCGIGYHGDAERKKVIGVRVGCTMPLVYQWYFNCKKIGEKIIFQLDHGDIYIMSEKATGNDFKKRKIYTLRHAAGSETYIQ